MRPLGTGSRFTLAWALACLGLVAGCRSSGIDPSGEHVFNQPPLSCLQPNPPSAPAIAPPVAQSAPAYREYPGNQLPWDNVRVIVNPSRCVAPIGSDVVVMAGVLGPDNYLRTNERVEWFLTPDCPGEFVDFDRGSCVDVMLGDFTFPRKRDGRWTVTSTSRSYLRLNRETPTPTDDVSVARGQTWVAVRSPVEGTSYVTAYAPSVYGWSVKKQTATIHWVDAEWQFPAPAIVSAGGSHVFTTTVTRHADHSPRPGWRVRYEVAGGPAAGFAPDGAPSLEVVTNEAGQANAEIIQSQPSAGTTQVNIQIIPPGAINGDNSTAISAGGTTVTWSAAQLAIRKTGPAVGAVGATLVYQIAVTNTGDLTTDDVTLDDEIPAGLELVGTNPPAQATGGRLQWSLGRLSARETRGVEVQLRATRAGTFSGCAEATAGTNLRVRDCATTVVGSASLVARIEGPSAATVGDQVQYTIIVENHGETTATGLLIKDRFDEGLQYAGPPSPIEKELEEIPPGQDRRVGVEFRVTRPGSLRHAVEVTGDGGASAAAEVYLNAAPSPNPPAAGNPPPAAPPVGRPAITVEKTGPVEADVGQTAEFRIVVRNTGDVPLTDVKVVDSYDPALHPFMADAGNVVRDNALVWNIGPMPIGAKSQFTIQCRCERAAAETVNRVTVTSAEVAEVADDAPVVVQAPRETQLPTQPDGAMGSGLAMSVDDLADNVDIGRTVNYEITIENKSAVIEEELVLEVDLPPGMKPLDASIRGPQGVGHAIDSQVIRFEPVGALRPGAQIRYELAMQAVTPGQTTLHARLRSRRLAIPLEGLEETTILGAR